MSARTLRPSREETTRLTSAAVISVSPIAQVRELPLYKEAEQACAAKRYPYAADLLLKLYHSPGLSPEESAFCLTQLAVCRKDAGLPPRPDTVSFQHTVKGKQQQVLPNTEYRTPNTGTDADCGPRALAIVCAQLKIRIDLDALRIAAGTTRDGTTMEGLAIAARTLGLKTEGVQVGRDALAQLQMPAIAWFHGNHFVAVLALNRGAGDASCVDRPLVRLKIVGVTV